MWTLASSQSTSVPSIQILSTFCTGMSGLLGPLGVIARLERRAHSGPKAGPAPPSRRHSLQPMATALSREAHQRLSEEYADLTTRGRVEIARQIEKARELGDLKENSDYHAAKDAQGKMESRIRQLAALLEDAEIVDEQTEPGDTV